MAPDLPVGPYHVQAQAPGFKVASLKNVVLNVGDRRRLDFAMQVGSIQESVTVEANEVRVQTDSGEVSNVITGKEVSQLTTNGRSIYTLINLTPGSSSLQSDFQTPTPVGGDANVSFNGNRPAHTIYLMDGGENLDRGGSGTFSVMPSLESLGEFRVLSSNYSAEYGLSSSATMSTVTRPARCARATRTVTTSTTGISVAPSAARRAVSALAPSAASSRKGINASGIGTN